MIQIMGKWTRTGYIQHIVLLAPATGLMYVKDTNVWGRYTY